MPRITREVIEYHLKIYPDAKPVSQKPRRQSVERQDFIREEVRKLLHAGFIKEVHHPVWLANPVIVPKANGKLRMCINHTSLNKACPQGPISTSTYRSDRGLYLGVRLFVFPRCLLRFSSNPDV
jgi:hypothetical protein